MQQTTEEERVQPTAAEERVQQAADVAEEAEQGPPSEVELSSGVRLKVRAVSPTLIRKAASRLPRPKPPVVRIPMGEDGQDVREEENPDHPDYLAALQQWSIDTYMLGADVMLLGGTEVLYVPEGMHRPEDDDWIELAEFFDVPVERERPKARYLAWLNLYALDSVQDTAKAVNAVATLSGITEEEVNAAMASFQNRAERRANKQAPDQAD